MLLQWQGLWGEWVLTRHLEASDNIGKYYVRKTVITLSPFGPPFRYRIWHRENKDWERWELPHVTTIEEAKACLQVALRMQ